MRKNTADRHMIEDFANLKKQGITNFICTTWNGNKRFKPVMKHTAQGVSSYANKMYDKYGDAAQIEVGYFDNNFNWKTYCIYSA